MKTHTCICSGGPVGPQGGLGPQGMVGFQGDLGTQGVIGIGAQGVPGPQGGMDLSGDVDPAASTANLNAVNSVIVTWIQLPSGAVTIGAQLALTNTAVITVPANTATISFPVPAGLTSTIGPYQKTGSGTIIQTSAPAAQPRNIGNFVLECAKIQKQGEN